MYYSTLVKGTNLSSKPPFWCVYLPPPPSEFRVKVFLNFSLPGPCPSPQESAQSAADTASQVPSPAPSDSHPIRRRPHRKQTSLLGIPETRGPAPGVVCEWGEGRGWGSPEPCDPDASSGELRGSEALLCAFSRPAAAVAVGPGTHGPGLRGAEKARPRPRALGPHSFGRGATGFRKRTRRALGSKAPTGLRPRISRLAETWS